MTIKRKRNKSILKFRDFFIGTKCPIHSCNNILDEAGNDSWTAVTNDHVNPLSNGGADNIGNLRPICKGCQFARNDTLVHFRNLERTVPDEYWRISLLIDDTLLGQLRTSSNESYLEYHEVFLEKRGHYIL